MKNLTLALLALALITVAGASASWVVVQDWNVSSATNFNQPFRFNNTFSYVGSNFQANESYTITNITMSLKAFGTPTGNIWIGLYNAANQSTYTAGLLATSNNISSSSINTSANGGLYTFSINTSVTAGNYYAIALFSDTGISAANYFRAGAINVGGSNYKSWADSNLNPPPELYDALGFTYGFRTWKSNATVVVPNMTITTSDLYDASAINTFNASVTWNGTTVVYNTTNGTIVTNATVNATFPANVTIISNNYFNRTYEGQTGSSLAAQIYQAEVRFNATEIISITSVDTFTVTAPSQANTNTTPVLYLKAGTYSLRFNKTGWYDKIENITVVALQNNTETFEDVNRYVLRINASNSVTTSAETSFSVIVRSGNYSYNTSASTTNGSVFLPWTNDTNLNVTIVNATNIATISVLANTSTQPSTPAQINITISGFTTNSLFIQFRDEVTNALIVNTTINLYVTSNITSYIYNTTTGYINATMITPTNYTLNYGGGLYTSRQYLIELNNQSYQTLILYLLSNSTGTYIRFTVLDQTYQTLQGATIDAQRKNLSGTNYYNVADCTTDNNGECLLFLETLTATYRFVTDYLDTTRTTADTILSRDTYTIVLNTGTSTLQSVLGRDDITANLNYTAPDSFYYTVNDENGIVQNGLLVVQRRYGGRLYDVSSSSGSGSSFTTSVTGVNTSLGDEIVASGYVYVDGQPVLTHRVSVIDSAAGGALGSGLAFLFLGMMFTIVFIFAWNPVAPLVAFGAFVIIMSRIGIIAMGGPAVVAVIIVLAVAVYRMRSV